MLDQVHQHFIEAVKNGRGDRIAKDPSIYSGLFWSGEEARRLGLVDDFASLDEVARDVMACFKTVIARTEPAHARLSKLMRSDLTLELGGPLMAGGQSLGYAQSDFDELSTVIGGRPVWLAASGQLG